MSSVPVHVEREGPVTVVTIDRPGSRNAIDRDTADGLLDAFVAFDADPDAAVCVLGEQEAPSAPVPISRPWPPAGATG